MQAIRAAPVAIATLMHSVTHRLKMKKNVLHLAHYPI